jgi:ribosomal protein S18 acetylase RimI-like enzyme
MKIIYKRATLEDISSLIVMEKTMEGSKIYSAMIKEYEWEEVMQDGLVYILEKEGRIIGNVTYEIKSQDHVYISGLLILPEFQRKGLGKEVMQNILQEIGNVTRIDLVTHPDNLKAIHLYKSFGFTIESRKENYFDDGEPRLIMCLVRN